MRIYPAIDIKGGQCVRLFKGDFNEVTVFADDPAEMAVRWAREGGEYIHAVDLDGAKSGGGINDEVIKRICSAVDIPVQVGGGIRSMEDIENKFKIGVQRVIIGTAAVKDMDFVRRAVDKYNERIAVGIDAKDGFAAVSGWEEVSSIGAVELAKKMEEIGVSTFIYTDISTDGTLAGPNTAAMQKMAEAVSADVIASGGVGNISHIEALIPTGVEGVIVGKALYTGNVKLADALALSR